MKQIGLKIHDLHTIISSKSLVQESLPDAWRLLSSAGPSSTSSTCRDGQALHLVFEELIFSLLCQNNWKMQLKEVFVSAHSLRQQSVMVGRSGGDVR